MKSKKKFADNYRHNILRFLMFDQIFFSTQEKRSVISSNKTWYIRVVSRVAERLNNLRRLENIRKISNVHRNIA